MSVAEWTSNNEITFLYTNGDLFATDCQKHLSHLFANNKYLVEARLRGWNIQISASAYDTDPECDVADIYITILHSDPDVTALESELIHKMLCNTPLQFKSATDTRSLAETFEEIT